MGTNKGKKKNTKKNVEEMEKTKQYKTKKGNKKSKKIWKRLILGMIILFVILAIIAVAVIIGIFSSSKYNVSREQLIIKNFNSKVVDSEGNVVATVRGDENRKWVSIEDMPEYLPKMFVALEDERYYAHKGIDIKRTIGATVGFVLGKGSSSYGGSTITQQLVKNTFNDKEDSGLAGVERKVREMARAYNVEKVLSKNEILELYLNKILMGGTYYGVGTASEYYFSKNVKDLSLAESAYLVAINPAPNAYKPFSTEEKDIEKIKNKTKVVLAKFKEEAQGLGYNLTDEAYNAAVGEVETGIAFKEGTVITGATSYSYHTAAAIEQAINQLMEEQNLQYDAAKFIIENNGYTIYSTQITSIQKTMEAEYAKDKYIVKGREKKKDGTLLNEGHTQSAMVIIEPTTGYVVGCMGGLGTDSNPAGINRATTSTKHPGSSIKPIVAVAPALETGTVTAATVFDDSATTFKGNYNPHNSGGYNGLLTVRHGIEHSSNIVNIKILTLLGPSKSAEFLRNMNFTGLRDDDIGASLALGAVSVTPLQMGAAYAMVANDGVYIEPTFYTKVEDSDGNVVLEAKQETKRMMSVENSYILKEILTAPVTGAGGTATTCWIKGMEVGAKTGSTDEYKDRWLCGITPYYAAACWFGFDNQETPKFSGNGAAKLWGEIMRSVHSSLPGKRFTKPAGVVTAKICLDSGCVATETCTRVETEYFAKGTVPKACEGHTKLKICKETGKIANEYCPEQEEKTFLVKPEKENTNLWSTKEGDKYKVPTENCDIHKEPEKIQVEVPNVIGKKMLDAKKILEEKKLKVEIVYEENKNKDDGIVLKQSKEEKTKVDEGTVITITVNKIKTTEKPNENTITNTTTTNTVNSNVVTNTMQS